MTPGFVRPPGGPATGSRVSRPLVVIGTLAAGIAGIAGLSRWVGHGGAPPSAQPVRSADLVMQDREDGAVIVTQAGDPAVLDILPPASNAFLRVLLSGLVRERRREGIGAPSLPFHLTRWSDGRLTLNDDATGKLIELNAFGPDNVRAFSRLLDLSRPPP